MANSNLNFKGKIKRVRTVTAMQSRDDETQNGLKATKAHETSGSRVFEMSCFRKWLLITC